ncbi:MAG: HAD-IB family phosphatase [Christensenellaceae bacterium]|nr:HAD-IB family phosphatase [Christensenellaceae bacterium]
MYETIFFVDFDGTVTQEETMIGAIRRIAPDGLFEAYAKKMASGELTLSSGLKEAFGKIPSKKFAAIPPYIDSVAVRPGFAAFLDVASARSIPVVIISGGLGQSVRRKLAPWRDRLLDVYAADLDLSGPMMRLTSQFDDGSELVAKKQVMKQYSYKRAACIGDSYTDAKMASLADVVFARDQLAAILAEQGKAYLPWEDFHDIARWLEAGR